MAIDAGCPRCTTPVVVFDETAAECPEHGLVEPLWRPDVADYDHFARMITPPTVPGAGLPTYLPWPLSPGWAVTDFGWVGASSRRTACVTTTTGTTDLDGEVELSLVVEEPGVGLGARCAGVEAIDPGPSMTRGPAAVSVRAEGRPVKLWSVQPEDEQPLERAVFAGESGGRWLWLVVTPAPAALLLRDEWLLADVTGFGPQALAMPFGERRSSW